MIKFLFSTILLLTSLSGVEAQRLIKGQKGFELSTGLTSDKGAFHDYFYVQAGLTINGKIGRYQLWTVEYSKKNHESESYSIPVESYVGEGGYSFVLLGDHAKNISLNLGISGLMGYEVINKSENLLSSGAVIQNKDSFIYGGGLRLSLETYLGNRMVFLIQGRTKAVFGTSVERVRPSAGLGLRYIF